MKISKTVHSKLKAALAEDVGRGDVTSRLLVPASARGRARILAREGGVLSGSAALRALAGLADRRLKVRFRVRDGQAFRRGSVVVEFSGPIRSILKVERTFLNLLGRLAGVATETARYVQKVRRFRTAVLDTRKTTPLWRELEKQAVRDGGGRNHRFGLFDEVFVKENHRRYGRLQQLRRLRHQFVIEARNLKEVDQAVALAPRVILLDNFSPSQVRRAVKRIRKAGRHIRVEASGGITPAGAARYAAAGVDQISVGALTHSARCLNFSLLVD